MTTSSGDLQVDKSLDKQDVIKGYHGLKELLDVDDFWHKQLYGTRLYYGNGVADYLHRDVLRAAVHALATAKNEQPCCPVNSGVGKANSITAKESKPINFPDNTPAPSDSPVEGNPECVAQWPDCHEGGYNPRCCRFPKSCSCEVHQASAAPNHTAKPDSLSAPTGSLLDRLETAGYGRTHGRAAIRVMAAWLRGQRPYYDSNIGLAQTLEQEAERG
jgi:hypothetical protein